MLRQVSPRLDLYGNLQYKRTLGGAGRYPAGFLLPAPSQDPPGRRLGTDSRSKMVPKWTPNWGRIVCFSNRGGVRDADTDTGTGTDSPVFARFPFLC